MEIRQDIFWHSQYQPYILYCSFIGCYYNIRIHPVDYCVSFVVADEKYSGHVADDELLVWN